MDWNTNVSKETGAPHGILEDGDYTFVISSLKKDYNNNKDCPQASLVFKCEMENGDVATVYENLLLHEDFEWKLCQFGISIGVRKHGDNGPIPWDDVVGKHFRAKVSKRSYNPRNAPMTTKTINNIDKFYEEQVERPAWADSHVAEQQADFGAEYRTEAPADGQVI